MAESLKHPSMIRAADRNPTWSDPPSPGAGCSCPCRARRYVPRSTSARAKTGRARHADLSRLENAEGKAGEGGSSQLDVGGCWLCYLCLFKSIWTLDKSWEKQGILWWSMHRKLDAPEYSCAWRVCFSWSTKGMRVLGTCSSSIPCASAHCHSMAYCHKINWCCSPEGADILHRQSITIKHINNAALQHQLQYTNLNGFCLLSKQHWEETHVVHSSNSYMSHEFVFTPCVPWSNHGTHTDTHTYIIIIIIYIYIYLKCK